MNIKLNNTKNDISFKQNEYVLDSKQDSYGNFKISYTNGDVYYGSQQNNTNHGNGQMIYANGDVYYGNWKNDHHNGMGQMTYANGDIYYGNWKNSLQNGKGKIIFYCGDLYKGSFNSGYIHGKGLMLYDNGDINKGVWEYCNFIEGTIYYTNGTLKTVKVSNQLHLPYSNGDDFYNKWWKNEYDKKNM